MNNNATRFDDDEIEIDLLQLFRALKKRILWIIGAGVLFGGAFGAFSKFVNHTDLSGRSADRKPADQRLQDHRNQPPCTFRSDQQAEAGSDL